MTTDIAHWYEEYQKDLDEFSALVDQIEVSVGDGRANAIAKCEEKVTKIKDVKKSCGLELRLLKDKTNRGQYDAKIKLLDKNYNELLKLFQENKTKANKSDLTKGINKNIYSTEGKGNDELISGAMKIQDSTMQSLDRTRGMIEQSKEVGAATLEVLQRQREQIKDIDVEVVAIDDNLKKAERLITTFTKRMASDRILQVLFALNVVILGAIIVYIISTKKTLGGTSSTSSGITSAYNIPTSVPTEKPSYLR